MQSISMVPDKKNKEIRSLSKQKITSDTLEFVLFPSEEQKEKLRTTMESFNRGCQYVCNVAHERDSINKIEMSKIVYDELRSQFALPSQMAIRVISKAIEARKAAIRSVSKTWRKKEFRTKSPDEIPIPAIAPYSPMPFDKLMVSFSDPNTTSLLCVGGRETIKMVFFQNLPVDENEVPQRGQLLYDVEKNVFYIRYNMQEADENP